MIVQSAMKRRMVREARRRRIRARVTGTTARPRLTVSRSNTGVYLQLVDDTKKATIVAVNDRGLSGKNKTERAKLAGKKLAELARKKNISAVVFDRAGFRYHGRIAAVAEGAREGGLTL
jgi:large subunit ribosomal protein L18